MASVPLEEHAYTTPKSTSYQSQHGEDKWLDEFFKHKKHGFFVEVGAYDGMVLSNSYHFEKERAWTGILVEPDERKADLCRKNRPNSRTYECAAVGSGDIKEISFFQVEGGEVYSTINLVDSHRQRLVEYGLEHREVRVKAMTMDQMLAEVNPSCVDFVSIDVEEGEHEVLKGFDIRRWKPKLVIVESNSSTRKPEIREFFVRNGYAYLTSVAINDFYSPVFGGSLFAKIVDIGRYSLSQKSKKTAKPYLLQQISKFLDRHILWRFKDH